MCSSSEYHVSISNRSATELGDAFPTNVMVSNVEYEFIKIQRAFVTQNTDMAKRIRLESNLNQDKILWNWRIL